LRGRNVINFLRARAATRVHLDAPRRGEPTDLHGIALVVYGIGIFGEIDVTCRIDRKVDNLGDLGLRCRTVRSEYAWHSRASDGGDNSGAIDAPDSVINDIGKVKVAGGVILRERGLFRSALMAGSPVSAIAWDS